MKFAEIADSEKEISDLLSLKQKGKHSPTYSHRILSFKVSKNLWLHATFQITTGDLKAILGIGRGYSSGTVPGKIILFNIDLCFLGQ